MKTKEFIGGVIVEGCCLGFGLMLKYVLPLFMSLFIDCNVIKYVWFHLNEQLIFELTSRQPLLFIFIAVNRTCTVYVK